MKLEPSERMAAIAVLTNLRDRASHTGKLMDEHVRDCLGCWRESAAAGGDLGTLKVILFCETGLTLMTRRTEAAAALKFFRARLSDYYGVPNLPTV